MTSKPTTRKKKRTRDSDEDTIDRLNSELRDLKALNRSLLRRIKKLDRNYEESLEQEEPEYTPPPKKTLPKCPNCKEGELEQVEIESLGKKYSKCNGPSCRYRTNTVKL